MARLDGPHKSSYGQDEGHGIHLPDKSYYPLIAAVGFAFFGGSLMGAWWLTLIAGVIMMFGIMGWIFEPVNDPPAEGQPEGHPEGHSEGHATEAGH